MSRWMPRLDSPQEGFIRGHLVALQRDVTPDAPSSTMEAPAWAILRALVMG